MTTIVQQLHHTRERIALACARAGRAAADVQLLAVSKTFGADRIAEAVAAGQHMFGENYVAEGVAKIERFQSQNLALEWHMIGPLQSNKTRAVAQHFHWVHSVDRLKIAQRLSSQRPSGMANLQVCLEVNASGESSKSGVAPESIKNLARAVSQLPHLHLRGLMCIPEPCDDPDRQRLPFALLRELLEDLQRDGLAVDTLSMGMSDDLEAAILEGATIVRVGRGIFGSRHYPGHHTP